MGDDERLPDDTRLYRWGEVVSPRADRTPERVGRSLIHWQDESPFGVAGVDCRPVSLGSLSATADPTFVERFGALCDSTPADYRGALPANAVAHPCQLFYSELQATPSRVLFSPSVFEDRWVLHLGDGELHFVNAWEGVVVLTAKCRSDRGGLLVYEVLAASADQSGKAAYSILQADFLIQSHVLDRWCPHPIPPILGRDADAIAQHAWITYGRRGLFATDAVSGGAPAGCEGGGAPSA